MPKSTAEELKRLAIGRKISALRIAKGMTVDELAEKLGLSKVSLRQIEDDVAPPTVATLLNIAKLLGVGIDHFFTDAEQAGKIEVTRVGERLTVHHDDLPEGENLLSYNYESLAYRLAKKHMEPFYVEFDAGPPVGEPWSHDGEEFIHVLSGKLEFIGGEEKILLNPGDSVYFYSAIPHRIRGVGPGKSKAIIVLYPYAQ
jgi:transcriptional regulator with XRE-family HTH domain